MGEIEQFLSLARDEVSRVVLYPVDPKQRIFWLYIVSSVAAAYVVYRAIRAQGDHATEMDREAASGSFLNFLFPKRVWSHPSAWLDLRYAFVHKLVSGAAVLALGAATLAWGYALTGPDIASLKKSPETTGWIIPAVFMFVAFLLADFTGWFVHMLQHKSKFLWQFHKVHHSAEVMHPVSNYREHPVDNLTYSAAIGFVQGTTVGAAISLMGYSPGMPTILGVPVLMFLFNILAYNLRHSHVWLRWPGRWSAVFPSSAHHHVHHSMHPDHIDKNFAFVFPVWDVIFGTYEMPADNRDVKFGVPEYDRKGLDSILGLYFVPVRDAINVLRNRGPRPDGEEHTGTKAAAPPAQGKLTTGRIGAGR
ncbi:MAG: sterol desaturase family protein [Pseudomonadota bacterium]